MVSLVGDNRFGVRCDVHATAVAVEVDVAINECKKGVVLAHANVLAGMPLGATLTNDDVSGDDGFATELFHTQAITA